MIIWRSDVTLVTKSITMITINQAKTAYKVFLFYVFLVLTVGCAEKHGDTGKNTCQEIKVNIFKEKPIECSTYFKYIEFTKLETREDFLISVVSKILFTDDRILLLQKRPESKIYTFDLKGKAVNQINAMGKGPGEYGLLSDLEYNKYNNLYEAFDPLNSKIYCFNKAGDFIEARKTKRYAETFFPLGQDSYICFFSANCFKHKNKLYRIVIHLANKDHYYLPVDKAEAHLGSSEPINFVEYNNSVLFTHAYTDTVYEIKDNMFYPKYNINFGSYTMPKSFKEGQFKHSGDYVKKCKKTGYVYAKLRLTESPEYVFFTCFLKETEYYVFYSKENGSCTTGNRLTYKILDKYIITFEEKPLGAYKNGLIFVIQSYDFLEKINKLKEQLSENEWGRFKTAYKDLYEIYSTTNSMDNPVIMYAKLYRT
jgi:hypothetical protein